MGLGAAGQRVGVHGGRDWRVVIEERAPGMTADRKAGAGAWLRRLARLWFEGMTMHVAPMQPPAGRDE